MRKREAKSRPAAKQLRRRMTDAETILWSRLRRHVVLGLLFRRQHPIGPYIADFACVGADLVVEVDGATHSTDADIAHDRRRDVYMAARGWRIVRVTNEDVYQNLDGVLDAIFAMIPPLSTAAVAARTPPP